MSASFIKEESEYAYVRFAGDATQHLAPRGALVGAISTLCGLELALLPGRWYLSPRPIQGCGSCAGCLSARRSHSPATPLPRGEENRSAIRASTLGGST